MRMRQGLFITGTDTGVGKTMVTAILACTLRQRGLRVGVMKPAETGCEERAGRLVAADASFLREISACEAPEDVISPYRLREAVAPVVAAEHEGVTIELERILACYRELAATYDIVLVEGAGGLLVPLTEDQSYLDLCVLLDLPMLVVARNMLGTINHTALTVTVAARCCAVRGIVLNTLEPQFSDSSQTSNVDSLRRWGRAPLLGVVPFTRAHDPETLACLGANLDLAALFPQLS